jgi:hypothetical protein
VRYWIKAALGLVLFVGGLAAFEYGLYHLMQVGTCASGGPYLSARVCPDTAGKYALMLPGGIIGGLIGLGLFIGRGKPPSGGERRIGGGTIGLFAWCALFIGTGLVCLYAALGGDPGPGAKSAGIFIGALFIPMGLIPAIIAVLGRRSFGRMKNNVAPGLEALRAARTAYRPTAFSAAPASPATPAAAGDPVERLRRLGELRATGVLSPAEFEAAKARILAEL